MARISCVSIILTPLVLLDLQITDVECGHNLFRRYYYYYYYHSYRYLNSTNYRSSEFKGWHAGAAVGVVFGSMVFLLLLSVCMKYCIQKMNRSRFIVKPTTTRTTTGNRPITQSAGRPNSSYALTRHFRRPFDLHRQLESNNSQRTFTAYNSNTDRNSYRPNNQRQNLDDVFSVERQLPEYREVCSPPPEYTENSLYTAHDQQEISNETTSGAVSPPPSYREATEQRSRTT